MNRTLLIYLLTTTVFLIGTNIGGSAHSLAESTATSDERRREAGQATTPEPRLRELQSDPDWQVRVYLGRNRRSPVDVLDQLAEDPHPQVRIAVATNLATPEKTLVKLARDENEPVRSVVARFEYVPLAALKILADDSSAEIRLEVAKNLNTSPEILQKLSQDNITSVANTARQALQRQAEEGYQPL